MTETTNQDIHDRIVGQNIPKRFLANVERNGSLPAIQWKDAAGAWASITFDELAEQAARLAASLADLGVGHGDRVVMMVANRHEFHPLDIAILFLGATPVSIYNSSAPDQIQYLVNDCGAKVAIVENDTFLVTVSRHAARTSRERTDGDQLRDIIHSH